MSENTNTEIIQENTNSSIIHDTLKGKVDIKWFGHSGFKISFKDASDFQRAIYIDIWIDNKNCPDEEKKTCPNDADLVLITHGQLDHSMHASFLINESKKENKKLIANFEICNYFQLFRKIPKDFCAELAKGHSKDFGFCSVRMVPADHPSIC